MQLSRAPAARGDLEEAASAARAALELYQRKGDKPRGAQARAELQALGA